MNDHIHNAISNTDNNEMHKRKAKKKAKEIRHEECDERWVEQETCRPWKMVTMCEIRMEMAMHQQDGI